MAGYGGDNPDWIWACIGISRQGVAVPQKKFLNFENNVILTGLLTDWLFSFHIVSFFKQWRSKIGIV